MSSALNDIPVSSHAAVGYFVDQKKGEVNELKQLMKTFNVERDIKRKREIIKKVIAYMTLGIDVSRLFTDMIMAIETKDIVVKKMVYLYLSKYAHSEPEMAIMCINSFLRECDNEDPLVRGLALRSLCSLRLESILEYVEKPLQKGLNDISAYVRKTAVLGVLKIHYLNASVIENGRYIDKLNLLLQDADSNVVTNTLYVIHEMKLQEGGIEATQTIVMTLLNRIGEFSEWGLNTILEIVSRYKPSGDDEVFAIMNLLDPVLRTANSGSVLAALKCFFNLTRSMPELHTQIVQRSKPPILTLITGAHAEIQYMTLKHLLSILHQPFSKGIFDDEYRQFFVRYNEPPHVKHLKVDLLPFIANSANARDIASELNEYVTDVDSELSRRAILALGEIASKISAVAEEMIQTILNLMDMDSPYVRNQAAIVLSAVIRIHPELSNLILPHLAKHLRKVEDSEAKAALIWLLGEFGKNILEAPYLLEQYIETYDDEASVAIKTQILTATMKLFFQRPPEIQKMLGKLFKKALNDSSDQDLHDRALLYYRLISSNVEAAKLLFVSGGPMNALIDQNNNYLVDFAENKDFDHKRKIFYEFNTLAVIFDISSDQLIDPKFQYKPLDADDSFVPRSDTNSNAVAQPAHQSPEAITVNVPPPSEKPAVVGSVNLLDWDEEPTPVASVSASNSQIVLKDYNPAAMTPQLFQQKWGTMQDVINSKISGLKGMTFNVQAIEEILRNNKIFVIASGQLTSPNDASQVIGAKLFAYSYEADDILTGVNGALFESQIVIYYSIKESEAVIKSDTTNQQSIQKYWQFIQRVITNL